MARHSDEIQTLRPTTDPEALDKAIKEEAITKSEVQLIWACQAWIQKDMLYIPNDALVSKDGTWAYKLYPGRAIDIMKRKLLGLD